MKKQELIHTHGLLAEVATYLEGHGDVELDLAEYKELEVYPESIHKSKRAHQKAVFALADGITASFPDEAEEALANGGTVQAAGRDAAGEYVAFDGSQRLTFEHCPPGRVETAIDELYDRHGTTAVNTVLEGMHEEKPLNVLYEEWDDRMTDEHIGDVYSNVKSTLESYSLRRDGQVNPLVWVYGLDADPNDVVSPRSYPSGNGGYAAD